MGRRRVKAKEKKNRDKRIIIRIMSGEGETAHIFAAGVKMF